MYKLVCSLKNDKEKRGENIMYRKIGENDQEGCLDIFLGRGEEKS